jgi:hypothetical protein
MVKQDPSNHKNEHSYHKNLNQAAKPNVVKILPFLVDNDGLEIHLLALISYVNPIIGLICQLMMLRFAVNIC